MEDHTIAVVMVLIALYLCVETTRYWTKHQKSQWLTAITMLDQAMKAMDALERWETARPLLNHSRCPYARHLIMRQIQALEYLAEHGYRCNLEHFEYIRLLYDLIERQPPDYDPPLADFLLKILHGVLKSLDFEDFLKVALKKLCKHSFFLAGCIYRYNRCARKANA